MKSGFRVPLYPAIPIVAMVLNLGLAVYQFWFDARSWYIALAWLGAGMFIYFAFVQKVSAAEEPKVLEVQQPRAANACERRILVPLHHPDHVIPLMNLAVPVAKACHGEIIVLGVIDIPINLPIHEGMRLIHHKTPLLKRAIQYGKQEGVETRSAVRIAHRVSDGILQTAKAERAGLIVMGWKGFTSTRDRIMGEVTDQVVRHAPCDLITVKFAGVKPIKRIIIPTAGGPHASLAAEYVGHLCASLPCEVSCCYVVPPEAGERQRTEAREWIRKTIRKTPLEENAQIRLIEGEKVASALVKAGAEFDLLVLGASKEGLFSNVLFGEIPEKVARYSRTSVMIVKRYEGAVKSVVKRVMG
jgi:nucleotide-binding universal stress UspA family protein